MIVLPARSRVVMVAAALALALTGCAAGQLAQTSDEVSAIDGVNRNVGKIAIRSLAIEAPTTGNYAAGTTVDLKVVLVNTGSQSDSLISMSGPQVTSWAALGAGASTGTQQVVIAPGSRVSYGTPDATGTLNLSGLKSTLYPGNSVQITLTFKRAGSITAQVPVQVSSSPGTAVVEEPSASSGE